MLFWKFKETLTTECEGKKATNVVFLFKYSNIILWKCSSLDGPQKHKILQNFKWIWKETRENKYPYESLDKQTYKL